jgi:predicted  nucleic acid-binding Zn-ribbon protein
MNANAKEFVMTPSTSNTRIKRRNIELEHSIKELETRNTKLELHIKELESRSADLEKMLNESTDAIFMYEMKISKLIK